MVETVVGECVQKDEPGMVGGGIWKTVCVPRRL